MPALHRSCSPRGFVKKRKEQHLLGPDGLVHLRAWHADASGKWTACEFVFEVVACTDDELKQTRRRPTCLPCIAYNSTIAVAVVR